MSLFFETIRVRNSRIENLRYHNRRLNETIKDIFGLKSEYDLKEFITPPKSTQLLRCKVIYDKNIKKISFFPYQRKTFKNLICIENDISYAHKSTDRSEFENLLKRHAGYDDIIITRDGLLTDISVANIAVYDGITWFTPKKPLLFGTFRASLIDKNMLKPKDITTKELKSSVKIAIMNAMIGFYELKDIKIRY